MAKKRKHRTEAPPAAARARALVEEARDKGLDAAQRAQMETRRREAAAKVVEEVCRQAAAESREAMKQARQTNAAARRELPKLRRAALRAAQRRVAEADDLEVQVLNQIEVERRRRPKLGELRARLARAEHRVEKIEAEIARTKDELAAAKLEINELKLRYDGQPATKKPAALRKLLASRNRLAKRLTSRDTRRTALEARKLVAMERQESLRATLAAREAGVHKGPVERDPRLRGLGRARTERKSQARAAKADLERGTNSPGG